jgi:hypothetical protein
MKTEDKHIHRNLECENGHPLGSREVLQRVFYGPDGEILFYRTLPGGLPDIRCPVPGCGAQPKDPNP